jgi:ABC-2 type transport system ATP-binding protein
MNDGAMVQIRGLTKRYGEFTALDALTMDVDKGQILGFIGPNGAGKTTTINILVGLLRPTDGTATIGGARCGYDLKRIRQIVGYMPDTFGLYPNMRVHEYLDFFGAAFKIPRVKRRKRIEFSMELTGATYMRDHFLESLSHGMKQRLGVARTLLHDPQVLILDEPDNGLDPTARIEMRQLMLKLAEMGKTLIVTSHILPELSRICHLVAIVTHGKLRAYGSLESILRQVSQRRAIEVQLLSEETLDSAAELIRQNVKDAEEVSVIRAESTIRFTTAANEKAISELLSHLAAQHMGVTQFHEVVRDLEDAFVSVTGQHASDVNRGDPRATAVASEQTSSESA